MKRPTWMRATLILAALLASIPQAIAGSIYNVNLKTTINLNPDYLVGNYLSITGQIADDGTVIDGFLITPSNPAFPSVKVFGGIGYSMYWRATPTELYMGISEPGAATGAFWGTKNGPSSGYVRIGTTTGYGGRTAGYYDADNRYSQFVLGVPTFFSDIPGGPVEYRMSNDVMVVEHTPEPGTLTLLCVGISGMGAYGWRRRRRVVE